ncbi:peptidoglycan endopeptidase LytF/peptidoglycan endopeptidase LytE [Hyunsoonleella jejuensis]|uniref:Peptidoglycan endopeptidase LytF/peptidoglycan endopeptidase LytE n=1 Tax=Hyunsoonleella jejuensis TaxID=419940 RepID=A0A1H9G0P2_9FLAO|nr:LysM peptidoglycan-binding domain-containing protein [Hyunsoonleella jejuensis]SEQ43288.1 peptidoglycan endopeptidase LytF/peptidoglycan endopeptidase LytE [Hyunsoonleella jejuensis]
MLKSFKALMFILLFCAGNIMLAQNKATYKDVLLNGKPAKLNLSTGEFILVDGLNTDTIKPLGFNSDTPIKGVDTSKISEVKVVQKDTTVISNNAPVFHVVKSGETLFGLAKKYGVSLNQLKEANNLETTLISVGQKLKVNYFDKIVESASFYIVNKGDTLYSISKKNGTTVKVLMQLNGLKSNNIYIGQKLRLK